MLIEFLIPAYMRKGGAAVAANSIIKQAIGLPIGVVGVWIQDDCSLNIEDSYYQDLLSELQVPSSVVLRITRNASNLGMSKNILNMAESTRAKYWTVLTDDDYLEEGSLIPLLEVVGAANVISCPLLFTPRYSYLESGNLHCVECSPFNEYPSFIPCGALSALKYCRNGFILTGMIVGSNCDLSAWKISSDNAFFPVINFGAALITSPCLVVDHPWFHHTVLNVVHWQSWGSSKHDQDMRLWADYLKAQDVVLGLSLRSSIGQSQSFRLLVEYFKIRYECLLDARKMLGLRAALSLGSGPELSYLQLLFFLTASPIIDFVRRFLGRVLRLTFLCFNRFNHFGSV